MAFLHVVADLGVEFVVIEPEDFVGTVVPEVGAVVVLDFAAPPQLLELELELEPEPEPAVVAAVRQPFELVGDSAFAVDSAGPAARGFPLALELAA